MKYSAIALALAAALAATPAAAQDVDVKAELAKVKPKDFPTDPIEFTVVYPAGGGMDVTGRLLAKTVEKISGDRIIVNNRTGCDDDPSLPCWSEATRSLNCCSSSSGTPSSFCPSVSSTMALILDGS